MQIRRRRHGKTTLHPIDRSYFIYIFITSLLPVLLFLCGLVLPPQYEDTFLGEMKYKLARLRETEGRRIIFVGASSVPFSIKSELIEANLPGYQVVDFGMYADMGTVVMLDWAKTEVHEGDLFIVMPEQSSQTLSCHFSGEDVWQAADGAPALITSLSPKRYEKLAAAFPSFAGRKLYYAVNGRPAPDGIYARASFNQYGDISYADRAYNIMKNGYNPADPILFTPELPKEEFLTELNAFAKEVTAKGGAVYYHFPPMNKQAVAEETTISSIDSYYDFLEEKLAFPILGNPHRCILDSGWFYDTNFHLNDSGAVIFTNNMIEDLKLLLLDTTPTEFSYPSMPQAPALLAGEGDDSCVDCFTYHRTANGWFIDGLTAKGLAAASLIIPFRYEGDLVAGISEDLFHGNLMLQELTVQSNIGILYDGMFYGCKNFQKLILTDAAPSAYSVGDSLMDGAEFFIYVPETAIDSYRRHYFWQKYSQYFRGSPLPAVSSTALQTFIVSAELFY